MVMSNFPYGIQTPFVTSTGLPYVGGRYRFVHSSGSNTANSGLDHTHPWKTAAHAVQQVDANSAIVCLAGHTEVLETDDCFAWANTGTMVIGMGWGAARPTFTVKTLAAASLIVDKASTCLSNLLFVSGIDDLTDPLVVNAADCILHNIEWRDASGMETIDVVWLKSGATRCIVDGLKIKGNVGGDSGQSGLHLDGCDDVTIKNFDIYGDFETGCIENVGDEALNVRILGGVDNPFIGGVASRLWTKAPEDLAIAMDAAATGFIQGPFDIRLADDAANIDECVVPGTCHVMNVGGSVFNIVNADGQTGITTGWPGTASTDA